MGLNPSGALDEDGRPDYNTSGAENRKRRHDLAQSNPVSRQWLSAEAKRALEDFDYFRHRYLGRRATPWQRDAAEHVVEWLVSPETEYAVVNCPPGSGKSTLFTADLLLWLICRDRSIRILIGSSTQRLAENYSNRLRRTLERTRPLPENLAQGRVFAAEAALAQDFGRFKPLSAEGQVGDAVADELQRLQLLLDQAREEAGAARIEAEQARESAIMSMGADEVATLKGQLAEIQQQVLAAVQHRESAEQALATLRQELQARDARPPVLAEPLTAPVLTQVEDAPRGSGLWLGMAAGVLFGALGVGAAFWFGKSEEMVPSTAQLAPTSQVAGAAPTMTSVAVAAVPPGSKKNDPVEAKPPAEVSIAAAPQVAVVSKGREFRDSLGADGRGPLMVEIGAARFAMGSGVSLPDFNEHPKHNVELPRFAIGKYEVTFDEFDLFARMTGRVLPDDEGRGRGRHPVVNVSWEDATAYVRWLSEQTGKRYRLPAEAEWEYAAGNLGRSLYWWGNTPGEGRANCYTCGSEWDAKSTAPVGSFAANPLGLFDTSGYVIEWVQDCYHANYDSAPANGSAWISVGCTHRVIRGGGYNSPASTLRLTKRDQQINNMRMDDLGFRVARDL